MKVFITPEPNEVGNDNGVGKVVEAQFKYLPKYDIELVRSPLQADVRAAHVLGDHLEDLDVLHLHGMYFTGDRGGIYEEWCHKMNARIIEGARKARLITMPSQWPTMVFKRDMRVRPIVIPNGVDVDEWTPVENPVDYLIWNKNRAADVCDPTPGYNLAERGLNVISTFAPNNTRSMSNYRIIGKKPFVEMKEYIRHSMAYLATTKEVFSLSVLEALASGVPILGYNWGGTREVVVHKQNGYLAEPGNIEDLYAGYLWIKQHRGQLSEAARETAYQYDWQNIIGDYAGLYYSAKERRESETQGVAVIITSYNYGKYLEGAIKSVLNQTYVPEEVIVVDDGSTDDTKEIAEKYRGAGIRYIYQSNKGVAHARNVGIASTSQPFIICLDADDELHPQYIDTTLIKMQIDRSLGISYTNLGIKGEDGNINYGQIAKAFDWDFQASEAMPPANNVPCAAMFRREMWKRSGGYRQVFHPAEDAEFWTRGLATGFKAEYVSERPLFIYNNHGKGAHVTKQYIPTTTWLPWVRDKQYPAFAPAKTTPLIRSYSEPLVSVVIPVGPNHIPLLPGAIESLLGQSLREWECIVVLDCDVDEELLHKTLIPYPFVQLYRTEQAGSGPSVARNIGASQALGTFLLFLDADDYLSTEALRVFVEEYAKDDKTSYIYSDWIAISDTGVEEKESPEYSQAEWLNNGLHAVTVLFPKKDFMNLGGFDEQLSGYEDWEFFLRAATQGYCGRRVPEALLAYRVHTGGRRVSSQNTSKDILAKFKELYGEFYGGKQMAACCGGNGDALLKVKAFLSGQSAVPTVDTVSGLVNLRYVGPEVAPIMFRVNGKEYFGANDGVNNRITVPKADAERLLLMNKWEVA